jgi:hypothetical protein
MDTNMTEMPEEEVGTWKCKGCGSVCTSDPDVVPAPCDFCGSYDIVPVDPEHPEAPTH